MGKGKVPKEDWEFGIGDWRWGMEDRGWRMGDGGWGMEDGGIYDLLFTTYEKRIANS